MANFKISEAQTGRFEGLYANNPDDKGKETYAGISRANWPKWIGWVHIDAIKTRYGTKASVINTYAKLNPVLGELISQFYKENFWDELQLDLVKDQQLADTVYDFGVNSGTGRSAKFLQTAINNTGGKVTVDGDIGAKTITAVNFADPCVLHTEFNAQRRNFYNSIATGNQKQFLKSWLSRLKPYKHNA